MNCREISNIEKLQKKFLLKKFKESVNDNKIIQKLNNIINTNNESLFLDKNKKINDKFNIIRKEITDKNIINEFKTILKKYYRYFNSDIKINEREFLSAWMIKGSPESVLEDINSIEKIYLLDFSNKLINELANKNFNIINFNNIFFNYSKYIKLFLQKDKLEKINYFTREWMNLEKTWLLINESDKYDNIQKDEIYKLISNDKKLIEKYFNSLSKEIDYNKLKLIINLSKQLSKKVIDDYKINLEIELINNNYIKFIGILSEIKKFLLIFNKNKEGEYEEKIDIEFYIQLIKSNNISQDDIYNFGDYIINEICKLGSLWMEEKINIKWNKLKENIIEKSQSNILSTLLIFLLEMINDIKNEIYDYKTLLEIIKDI